MRMIGSRIFYVSTTKRTLESEDWVSFVDETIYGLVDFAIMQGVDKWYLYPQVGYYRF